MAAAAPLRVAVTQEVGNLNPYSPGVPEALVELIYDKLAAPSPFLANATPWLAAAISPEGDDGHAWRIRLRDHIRWHDGKPFGAEDVAFTLRYYRDGPANGRWTHHVSDTPRIETIEVLERLTLRIRCAQPCPEFDKVTAADLPILPAHRWRGVKEPHRYQGPVIGTGPYRLTTPDKGRRYLRLEANPDYFGGTPRVETILVSVIRNMATAFAALYADEVDLVAAPVPFELVDSVRRRAGLAVLEGNPLTAVEMRLNYDRLPFSDPAFRAALALLLDPKEVLQRVALGQGRPGSLGYPHPDSPWTARDLSRISDPVLAAKRLDELGFRDRDGDGRREDAKGSLLRFNLKVSSSEPLHLRAAQVVARQLDAAGIEIRVEAIDPGRQRALFSNRQFDLMITEIGPHGLADPNQLVQSLRGGYLWRADVPNPTLDALLDDWWQADTAENRIAAGFALQRLHNAAPTTIVLYYPNAYWAYRPAAFAGWLQVPGQGILHKWSLLRLDQSVSGLAAR